MDQSPTTDSNNGDPTETSQQQEQPTQTSLETTTQDPSTTSDPTEEPPSSKFRIVFSALDTFTTRQPTLGSAVASVAS